MNEDEFAKLDALMQRNSPALSPSSVPRARRKVTGPIITTLGALGLASILLWTNVQENRLQLQAMDALEEEMLWDATTDELPDALAEEFELFED